MEAARCCQASAGMPADACYALGSQVLQRRGTRILVE